VGWESRPADRVTPGATTLLTRLLLYWHTIRYLRISQILWRLWYGIYRPIVYYDRPLETRRSEILWRNNIIRGTSFLSLQYVKLLNLDADISSSEIWNDAGKSKLWLYNLHYFNDLNATDAKNRVVWHHALIARWISENPPALGIGWEPYPTSLRIVNWIKWIQLGNKPTLAMQQSLRLQVRWLRKKLEFHLRGNHLLANAKALIFAGLYFSGEESDCWFSSGLAILETQLGEQILPDGGHFELSPMYHLIVMEDLLDLVQIFKVFGRAVPSFLIQVIPRMSYWSLVMRHPDGEIPFFNDACFGFAGKPEELDLYVSRLGFTTERISSSIQYLQSSGYLKMASGDAVLFVDLAPVGPEYLPGHAHADTMSFELSLAERRIVVNSGTSVYGAGHDRQQQRGTASHSTVTLDGADSSEVWGGFRVARRARLERVEYGKKNGLWVSGAHDGYKRLPGSPVHHREWRLTRNCLWVLDVITGQGRHVADINFPLMPGLVPRQNHEGGIDIVDDKDGHSVCLVCFSSRNLVSIKKTTWHPGFGMSIPNWRLTIHIDQLLPIKHIVTFNWNNV
jgi:uncharacterized heparinase superfamily protein